MTRHATSSQEREGGIGGHVSPLAQISDVAPLLSAAGLSIPTLDTSRIVVDYPDAFACRPIASSHARRSEKVQSRFETG